MSIPASLPSLPDPLVFTSTKVSTFLSDPHVPPILHPTTLGGSHSVFLPIAATLSNRHCKAKPSNHYLMPPPTLILSGSYTNTFATPLFPPSNVSISAPLDCFKPCLNPPDLSHMHFNKDCLQEQNRQASSHLCNSHSWRFDILNQPITTSNIEEVKAYLKSHNHSDTPGIDEATYTLIMALDNTRNVSGPAFHTPCCSFQMGQRLVWPKQLWCHCPWELLPEIWNFVSTPETDICSWTGPTIEQTTMHSSYIPSLKHPELARNHYMLPLWTFQCKMQFGIILKTSLLWAGTMTGWDPSWRRDGKRGEEEKGWRYKEGQEKV